MATKVTIKDMFNEVIALAQENGRDDIVEFAKGRIAVLDKKAENKKATKTQVENEGLKVAILDFLTEVGEPTTIAKIVEAVDGVNTPQKASSLLRQLAEAGKAVRSMDKKTVLYAVAE